LPLLCHSNLRLEAEFLVMFPHSDWIIMTQVIKLLLATPQIFVKIALQK